MPIVRDLCKSWETYTGTQVACIMNTHTPDESHWFSRSCVSIPDWKSPSSAYLRTSATAGTPRNHSWMWASKGRQRKTSWWCSLLRTKSDPQQTVNNPVGTKHDYTGIESWSHLKYLFSTCQSVPEHGPGMESGEETPDGMSRTMLRTPTKRETGETHSLSQQALQTSEGPGVCGGEQARRIPQHPAARAGFGFPLSLSIETLYGRPENLSWSITSGFFFSFLFFLYVCFLLLLWFSLNALFIWSQNSTVVKLLINSF